MAVSSGAASPRVFLSHAGADTEPARDFVEILRNNGIDVWFDKDSLAPGDCWMDAIERAIQASSAMLVYVGQSGAQNWVDREVRLGLELNTRDANAFRLIPVFGDGADVATLPPFLSQQQGISERDPDAIRRLLQVLRADRPQPAVPPEYWVTHSPFRSLRSFGPQDSWLFFGRDRDTDALLERLERSQVLVVIGNSGSGKSSLVRAGLIPALRRGRLRADGRPIDRWHIAVVRPGNDPFGELADRLAGQLVPALPPADRDALITRWRQTFPRGGAAVRNGIAALSLESGRTLLFVDQFEELFAVAPLKAQHTYIDALLKATEVDGVQLVVGLRADFYANCLRHAALKKFLQDNYSVSLLTADQLRESIEKRLALAGASAEAGLTDALLADVGTEPGNLALLEHALALLWEHNAGKYRSAPLTNQRYEEIGRLKGAVGKHAQGVYADLNPEQQPLARRIFLELVHLGEGAPDTRRRVTKEKLLTLGHAETAAAVLDVLASKRLIATSGGPADAQSGFVEVSHEALIRSWPLLQQWIEQDREGLHLARRLSAAAREWERSGRDESLLYRGSRIQQSLDWGLAHRDDLTNSEWDFLRASEVQQQREADEKNETLRKQLDLAHRIAAEAEARQRAESARAEEAELRAQERSVAHAHLRSRARMLVAIAAIAFVSGLIAIGAWQLASHDRARYRLRTVIAAAQSQAELDPTTAALVLLETAGWPAVNTTASDEMDALDVALDLASSSLAVAVLRGHERAVESAAFSSDGRLIVTASDDGTARVWCSDNRCPPIVLRGHEGGVTTAAFNGDRTQVVTGSEDGTVRVWCLDNRCAPVILKGHIGAVRTVMFSADGQFVLSGGADGTARMWNWHTNGVDPLVREISAGKGDVTFNSDGTLILGGTDNTYVVRWTGERITIPQSGFGAPVVSRNGDQVLISDPEVATIWNLAERNPAKIPLAHHDDISWKGDFSLDGRLVATPECSIGEDWSSVCLWDAKSGRSLATLDIDEEMEQATFGPDGRLVAATGGSGRIYVVTHENSGLSQTLEFRGHQARVNSIRFSGDGKLVVTASDDGTARVWAAKTRGEPSRTPFDEPLGFSGESAVFSADGRRLVTAGGDNIFLWDVDDAANPKLLAKTSGKARAITFTSHRRSIVSAEEQTIRVRSAESLEQIRTLDNVLTTYRGVSKLIADRASDAILIRFGSGTTKLYNPLIEGPRASLGSEDILDATFESDRGNALTISRDGDIRSFSLDHPFSSATVRHIGVAVESARFSEDGSRVLTSSSPTAPGVYEDDLYVWSVRGTVQSGVIRFGINPAVELSADGAVVLTSNAGRTALWSVSGSDGSTTGPIYLPSWQKINDFLPTLERTRLLDIVSPRPERVLHPPGLPFANVEPWRFQPGTNRVLVGTAASPELMALDFRTLVSQRTAMTSACLTVGQRVHLLGETSSRASQATADCDARNGR